MLFDVLWPLGTSFSQISDILYTKKKIINRLTDGEKGLLHRLDLGIGEES